MAHFFTPRTIEGQTICCNPSDGFILLSSSTDNHSKYFNCCSVGGTLTVTVTGSWLVEVILDGVNIDSFSVLNEQVVKPYTWAYSSCGHIFEVVFSSLNPTPADGSPPLPNNNNHSVL